MEYKNIELEHILLELKNNRAHHFRHFIDQYFCYKNNYVTRSGKASWGKIAWSEYVSTEANKTRNKSLVVEKEHIVPLNVITSKLIELGTEASIASIKQILDKYLHFATITKNEDKVLNKLGLKSKMPNEFYDKNNREYYENIFARYDMAGIDIKEGQR